ncbi:type I restriction enzyme S subunit [Methanohalophilus euhalobius]|uniref:Type I restriction enzyme S subunit n=1 Tax=Methanohalophilus euhalobius TaxID=51203 RepID=A0A285FW67_9EURY|nr:MULTISPECIES: restriction endonuclease subunit S [Methanohalophilus]ODV49888.1 MAG: type I restriction enzyme, S subunit [Methanohalophilus sp. 2-GBenrich]TCL11364.1 type I restriction enzyme S subunit [Methanohalophilus euhalobius]SNY15044.1 type I restriction enzyme, S subunit [Methanohalophilus euhalobius]
MKYMSRHDFQSIIPEGFHEINLGDLITFQRGHDLPKKKRKKGSYPVVASNGIVGFHNEFKVKGPGVIVGRSGNIGEPYYINKNYWPLNTTLYVKEFKSTSPEFVYYFLKSINLGRYNSGSAVPSLNRNYIHPLKIKVPKSITYQNKIASLLSTLDDKIELNRRMNATLEQIAQAIFKQWFIDFEFPDENGQPYKSSGGEMVESEMGEIPRGWRVGKLKDICEINMGQSPPGKTYNENGEGTPFYQGITDFGFRFPTRRIYCTEPKKFAEKNDVLLSVRAPVGSLNISNERCAIGRGLAALRLKENHGSFLYYLLLSTKHRWSIFESGGTVFSSINKSNISEFELVIPPDDLISKFNNLILSKDEQIFYSTVQNNSLSQIRDFLLPKLISGKIRQV